MLLAFSLLFVPTMQLCPPGATRAQHRCHSPWPSLQAAGPAPTLQPALPGPGTNRALIGQSEQKRERQPSAAAQHGRAGKNHC